MRRVLAALPALVLCLSAGGAPAQAPAPVVAPAPVEPLPGRWEYKYRLLGLVPAATEYWCLKADEVDRAFQGPCNRHHTCTYPTREVGGGRVKLAGQWADKRGRVAPVSGQGSYTPTTINLSVRLRTTTGIPLAGTLRAKRLGDACQPGDK